MKFQSFRVALLSATILASPLVTFAGSQPKVRRELTKSELQDRTGVTRAVQQGKGSGMTRNDASLNANAYRVETPADRLALGDESSAERSNRGDVAFRK